MKRNFLLRALLTCCCVLIAVLRVAAQGTESFANIPTASTASYLSRTWTGDNGQSWSATDARTDQTITSKAITIRNGSLTAGISSAQAVAGLSSVTISAKAPFGSPDVGVLELFVNGVSQGTKTTTGATTSSVVSYTWSGISAATLSSLSISQNTTGSRITIDDLSWAAASAACTAPTMQALAGTAGSVTASGATLNWIRGNGNNVIVVARLNSTAAAAPLSGTTYTANAAFGSGATTGTGNYVVYDGTGTSISISGLSAVTAYKYDVYEYNSTATCYLTPGSSSAAFTTLCAYPTQATAGAAPSAGTTTATISFTAGGGSNRLVLVKAGSAVSDVPADGTAYTANASFSSATALGASKIVYAGTASSVSITTLSAGTTYYYAVFEYNSTTKCYQTTSPVIGSFTTVANTSDVVSAGGEATGISSLTNGSISTNTDGTQVWNFTVRDGGGTADGDALPTIVNAITVSRISSGSPVADWSATINDAALFDGVSSTPLAHAAITSSQLQFTGLNLSTPDDGNTTYTLRITLKNPLGATDDGKSFVFSISNGNFTTAATGSSQKASFAAAQSAVGANVIDVAATKLVFAQQPSNTGTNQAMSPAVKLNATDANGNIDLGFTSAVSITSAGTLSGSPVSVNAVAGVATFSSLTHTAQGTGLLLTAASAGLAGATSTTFNIFYVTTFAQGDLAIVAVNTDASRTTPLSINDEISLVSYVDITAGTSFYLTDNGYERSVAGKWGNTEGVLQLTRNNSTLNAGRVFTIVQDASGSALSTYHIYACGTNDDANWTLSYVSGMGSSFDLSSTDQVWAMQGGAWTPGASQQATYNGTVLYGWTASGWQAAPGYASTSGSTIVPEASCFTTNVASATPKVKFNLASFTASNDKYGWIGTINQPANWTSYLTNTNYNSGGTDFLGSATCVSFGITTSTAQAGQWMGTANHNWFDCSNWQTLRVPDSTTNVTINNTAQSVTLDNGAAYASLYGGKAYTANLTIAAGNTLSFGNNANGLDRLNVYGNLTVQSTGTVDLQNGTLAVKGNLDNQSALSNWLPGTSTVILNGGGAQTLSATSATVSVPMDFYNLQLQKTSGTASLSSPARVSGAATFTTGNISTSTAAPLIFADGATAAGASTASYAAGPVRKLGDDAFSFPIGKGGRFRPVSISAPASTSDVFTAEYFNVPYTTTTVTPASGLHHVSYQEYWDVDRTMGSSVVDVTLNWGTGSNVDLTQLGTLRVAHFNGLTWDNLGVSSTTSTSITRTGVSSFSPFTLGTTSGTQPLPLRLLSFEGAVKGTNVQLQWKLACEEGMKDYSVEKSEDGQAFRKNGNVAAQNKGCGNEAAYSFTDAGFSGNAAYRLKLQDAHGAVSYSPVRYFRADAVTDGISLAPNPAQDMVRIEGLAPNAAWRITDSYGRTVLSGIADGHITEVFVNGLAGGMYFLQLPGTEALRFVKQ